MYEFRSGDDNPQRCGKKSASADFVCDKNSVNFYLQSTAAFEQHNGAVLGADYFICVRRIETVRFKKANYGGISGIPDADFFRCGVFYVCRTVFADEIFPFCFFRLCQNVFSVGKDTVPLVFLQRVQFFSRFPFMEMGSRFPPLVYSCSFVFCGTFYIIQNNSFCLHVCLQ